MAASRRPSAIMVMALVFVMVDVLARLDNKRVPVNQLHAAPAGMTPSIGEVRAGSEPLADAVPCGVAINPGRGVEGMAVSALNARKGCDVCGAALLGPSHALILLCWHDTVKNKDAP